jgi:hypothetical protein
VEGTYFQIFGGRNMGLWGRFEGGTDLVQCFKTDGQLVVGYSLTPAFG